jgi:hypothetical protein
VQALGRLVDETLRNGQSTKTDVREFLKAHFSNVPVMESSREIAAGPMLLRIPVDRDRAFRFNVTEDSEFA